MNDFMKRLQASGYDKSTRYHVMRSASKAYEKIKENDANGIRPMYRSKNWNATERRKSRKDGGAFNWFPPKMSLSLTLPLLLTRCCCRCRCCLCPFRCQCSAIEFFLVSFMICVWKQILSLVYDFDFHFPTTR